jgi:hypothetical protein
MTYEQKNTALYSEYVSLGYNCEVGFQIRRVLGREDSSFFNWNITHMAQLKSLLASRFSGILKPDNLEQHADGGLVLDKSHGHLFHSPFATPNPFEDDKFEAHLEEYRNKTNYLIDKFYDVSGKRRCYFYKSEVDVDRKDCTYVRDELAKLGNDDFSLVILRHRDLTEDPWGEDQIYLRYLRRLAPWDDAADGHIDSWDAVFREFPHRDPMRLAIR